MEQEMGRGWLRLLPMQAVWADYHPLDSPLSSPFWVQLCSSAIPLFQSGCIWELWMYIASGWSLADSVWPGFTSCCNMAGPWALGEMCRTIYFSQNFLMIPFRKAVLAVQFLINKELFSWRQRCQAC